VNIIKLKLLALATISILSTSLGAKVDPPNYDFSLDKFKLFMPGKSLKNIEAEYKFKELMFKGPNFKTYKFFVEHIRYKFPIFVQFKDGIVTDFHARLPAYFLHDIFHQSLINRLGAQDIYKKSDEQALYIWKNKAKLHHSYSGACGITCYPIFYAVRPVEHKFGAGYTPIIKKLIEK
jgi:hypothetical protein